MKSSVKAIVIGSGIAGLASAVRLAVQGFEVIVFEKNGYPGGKLYDAELNGFHFDTGPSLFVQPQSIEELFELAGEHIADYFEYTSLPVACKYFYEDGIEVNAYTDTEKFSQELFEKTGEDPNRVKEYLRQSSKLYNNIGSVFLNHSIHKRRSIFKAQLAKAVGTIRWKYLFNSMNNVNRSSFTKTHTVQLFNRYATYNGSNPYKAPALLCLIPHLEFNDGKVKGVVVNNQNITSDIVVSNVDVYVTYSYLLNDEIKAHKLLKQERSSSALVFYWGINKKFTQLQLHNIFFSKNYKAEFDHIFHYKRLYNDPTVYINITAKCEASHAPAGKENWFVMVNAPANFGQNWNAYNQQCKENIIAKLNRMLHTDIEPLIEAEETLDPVYIEAKTGSFKGAIYGSSSNSRMAAFLRHPNYSKHIRGLYFAGGTVHPGGGIPLCLKSAKIMSDIIEEDVKHFKH